MAGRAGESSTLHPRVNRHHRRAKAKIRELFTEIVGGEQRG
jgi:hypothetical protein